MRIKLPLHRIALAIGIAITCLFLLTVTVPSVFAQVGTGTIRVAPAGTDASGCGSAASPCKSIQFAVNQVSASGGDTILVAAGTYTYGGTNPSNLCLLSTINPSVVCSVNKFVTIRGGYNASSWSGPDPVANPTIIDGQGLYRGVSVVGTSATTSMASLTMEGVTIQNGLAQGASSGADWQTGGYGGGMFGNQASVTLRNMTFKNNNAKGGNTGSSAGGAGVGGGLALSAVPALSTLDHVTFDGNHASGGTGATRGGSAHGGGLTASNAAVNATYVTLTNNTARGGNSSGSGQDGGGTSEGLGGGAAMDTGSNVTLQYLTATGNQAIAGNGSTYGGNGQGGALFAEAAGNVTVLDSTLSGNLAQGGSGQIGGVGGGTIQIDKTNMVINRTVIINNTAKGGNGTTQAGGPGGGGIYAIRFAGNTTISILNSIIADNYIEPGSGPNPAGGGGGLYLQGVQIDIVHTTISGNRMHPSETVGVAMLVASWGTPTPTIANISYSIIANHSSSSVGFTQTTLHVVGGNTANLNRGLFANNTKNTNADSNPSGFSGLDTMLTASSAGFVSPGSPYYNYHILSTSAAKDQAIGSTTSIDIDNQSRPYNGVSDIGADEYSPFTLNAIPRDGFIGLNWPTASNMVVGALDHYEVVVTCPPGANPPNEGACGQPINAGTQTSFTLTGLTNFKTYTIVVNARDARGNQLLFSTTLATPTNIFLYLPLVLR